MEKSLYGYYMGYMCHLLNDEFIRHWVAPTKEKDLERQKANQGLNRLTTIYLSSSSLIKKSSLKEESKDSSFANKANKIFTTLEKTASLEPTTL
ncbi:hypothetical protein D3C78_1806210 [compost metagenome]